MISRKRIFEECQASGISEATAKRAIKKMLEDEFIDFIVDPNDKRNKLYILTNHVKSQEQENE